MPTDPSIEAAIRQAAEEAGEDPAYGLAVAERESRFNPRNKASKSMRGLFQMSGKLRAKYGVGDSDDPLEQARGFYRFLPDLRREMKSVLGRDPTHEELYLGHHYGGKRAARTTKMDPNMPVEGIFTPQEMGQNPHFARAGTIGNLNGSVMGDVRKRMSRFGGAATSPANAEPATNFPATVAMPGGGAPAPSPQVAVSAPVDLSSFGDLADGSAPAMVTSQPEMLSQREPAVAGADLSSFGVAV